VAGQELGQLDRGAAVPWVLDLLTGLPRGPGGEVDDLGGGAGGADLTRVDTQIGQGVVGHRLGLGGHDALERRVAGLVDALDHADHGRAFGLDHVVAVLGLAVDADGGAVHLQLLGPGQAGPAQVLGQGAGDQGGAGVGRLRAAEHDVRLDAADGRVQDLGRVEGARPVEGVVVDVHGRVRAHGQRLAHRGQGRLRAHAEDHHLAALLLLQPQGLLDGVLVDRVEDRLDRLAVERLVPRVQPLLGGRVGHALDGDQDLQRCLQGMAGAGPRPGRRP
jgi:hypothetical protein